MNTIKQLSLHFTVESQTNSFVLQFKSPFLSSILVIVWEGLPYINAQRKSLTRRDLGCEYLTVVPIKDTKTQIHKENKYKDIYHSKLLDIS